jgi:Uncharacterized protein conserved in bacteria
MRAVFPLLLSLLVIAAAEVPKGSVPVPQPRPETGNAATPKADETPAAQPNPAPDAGREDGATAGEVKATPPGDPACEAALTALGATFERIAPVTGEGGCGFSPAYRFTRIGEGIELEPAAEMRCATGLALAQLVAGTVAPAVAALDPAEGGAVRKLTAIRQASAYVCRPRNNQAGAKLSEHSTGAAIDIAGFVFSDGSEIAVEQRDDDHTITGAFQAAVRGGACLHFPTVLGPGADAHHSDHLHLDMADRGGGYRICQ